MRPEKAGIERMEVRNEFRKESSVSAPAERQYDAGSAGGKTGREPPDGTYSLDASVFIQAYRELTERFHALTEAEAET